MQYNPYIINMEETYDILKDIISPSSVIDIGAYNGKDGAKLAELFNIPIKNTWFIEAHPDMVKILRAKYPNVIECAVSDNSGESQFNAVDLTIKQNHGVSSLLDRKDTRIYKKIKVIKRRMDEIIDSMEAPLLVKIDTEGCTWEVLQSFGDKISMVQAFHVECEHKQIWKDQKTYEEVAQFLKEKGFFEVSFKRTENQSDSIWVYPQEKLA